MLDPVELSTRSWEGATWLVMRTAESNFSINPIPATGVCKRGGQAPVERMRCAGVANTSRVSAISAAA